MSELFKLPASSYEEIIKIIKAYSEEREGVPASLDSVAQSCGLNRTVISGNNGFLVQVGIITEGNKKAVTPIGRSLGRAYSSNIKDEVERIWGEITNETDFMNRMVSAVRIRNGMDRANFINHIVYSSGQKDTKQNRAGAGALLEILKAAKVLSEEDGKIVTLNKEVGITKEEPVKRKVASNIDIIAEQKNMQQVRNVDVTVNININCSVSELNEVAEKINDLIKGLNENQQEE